MKPNQSIDPERITLFKWFDQVRKVFPGARVRIGDDLPFYKYQVRVELQTYGYPTYNVQIALHDEYLRREDYLDSMLHDIVRQLAYMVLEGKQL